MHIIFSFLEKPEKTLYYMISITILQDKSMLHQQTLPMTIVTSFSVNVQSAAALFCQQNLTLHLPLVEFTSDALDESITTG